MITKYTFFILLALLVCLLSACTEPPPAELVSLMNDSSRTPAQTGSWEANRRFYLLARFYERAGVKRCTSYPKQHCQSPQEGLYTMGFRLPSSRQPEKQTGKNVRTNLGKNLVIPFDGLKTILLLPYAEGDTTPAMKFSTQVLECLFEQSPIKGLPSLVYYEGGDGLLMALQAFPNGQKAIPTIKNCQL